MYETEKKILAAICDHHSHRLTYTEAKDALVELDVEMGDDFYFKLDGNEYRIIAEDAIWKIYVDEIRQIVEDCYDLKLNDMPDFLVFEIDWEATAKNCYADGYGHTFSSYDFSEIEAGGYYIFRTN
jgi:hypothetical protein